MPFRSIVDLAPIRRARRRRGPALTALLVGYGARGREWATACADAGIALVGVVDPDAGAGAAATAAGLRRFATLPEALAACTADAGIVASPPAAHVEDAAACAEAGLTVLVEKPLALGLSEARTLEQAARPVLVGQNFRFLPRERALAQALASGRLGTPVSVAIVSARPATAAAPHLATIRNGPLWDIVLHHLDALRVRFGDPATVDATRTHAGAGRTEYALELTWDDGLHAAYRHCEGAAAFHHHEWLDGTDASLVVDDQRVWIAPPGSRRRRVQPPRAARPEQQLLAALADAAAGRPPAALTVADNVRTIALVEAAERSLAEERSVALGRAQIETLETA